MNYRNQFSLLVKVCALLTCCFLWQCSDENIVNQTESAVNDPVTTAAAVTGADCGCTYTVPANTNLTDGAVLGLKPGSVICLNAAIAYGNLLFRNLKGSATNPIIIKNCGGVANVNGTGKPYAMKTETSQYFHITGGTGSTYGIKLTSGSQGLTLDKLSTNFEVDHLDIGNSGFAGIMAKTDPSCDNATIRGNFVMRDVLLHDNYVHDTAGEGFYVGNSFYNAGVNTSCGLRYPHAIEGLKIYNNIVKNSGWESIQVGSTPKGSEVYNNRIENYGAKNVLYQNNGVQFGEGARGKLYGNYINGGKGSAINIIGNGENFIHDNVIVNAGAFGIFCDERDFPGTLGMQFINNTIINPVKDGIRIYTDLVPMNVVLNNIIVNPGSYTTYTYPRTGNDAYVYLLSKTMKAQIANNYFTRDINAVKFVNPVAFNYALSSASPAVNKGFNIATYNIPVDFLKLPRLKGTAYDVGACEY
jgi:hypothetical protein